jgi:predicted RNA-binding Zn-ribbon protein involved in translation (DUF1610 family)
MTMKKTTMPLSIEKTLRALPEMARFSKAQQDNLLESFNHKALWRKAMRSSAYHGAATSLPAAFAASLFLPKFATLIVIACVILIIMPIAYVIFVRQLRDEFRLLLMYLLTGATLPVCARCGYDLTGVKSYECPECGADVKWHGAGHREDEPPRTLTH